MPAIDTIVPAEDIAAAQQRHAAAYPNCIESSWDVVDAMQRNGCQFCEQEP